MKGAKINLGYNQKTLQHETPSNVIQQIWRQLLESAPTNNLTIAVIYFTQRVKFYHRNWINNLKIHIEIARGQSRWSRSLKHETASLARTLGLWVRIPLEEWVYVRVFCVFVLFCVSNGLAMGWSPVQAVLPAVSKTHSSRLIFSGNMPEGLIGQRKKRRRF
jgi:hypothetical protein